MPGPLHALPQAPHRPPTGASPPAMPPLTSLIFTPPSSIAQSLTSEVQLTMSHSFPLCLHHFEKSKTEPSRLKRCQCCHPGQQRFLKGTQVRSQALLPAAAARKSVPKLLERAGAVPVPSTERLGRSTLGEGSSSSPVNKPHQPQAAPGRGPGDHIR